MACTEEVLKQCVLCQLKVSVITQEWMTRNTHQAKSRVTLGVLLVPMDTVYALRVPSYAYIGAPIFIFLVNESL